MLGILPFNIEKRSCGADPQLLYFEDRTFKGRQGAELCAYNPETCLRSIPFGCDGMGDDQYRPVIDMQYLIKLSKDLNSPFLSN